MLYNVSNFRAISILLIVLGHCYWISGWIPDSKFDHILKHYMEGGTYLFLFISGYMFSYVSLKKYQYKSFLKSKVKNIFLPYLVISIPLIIIALITKNPYGFYFFNGSDNVYERYIQPFFSYLFTGRVITGFWYMPFIFFVFLSAPLIVRFLNLRLKFQVLFIAIQLIISTFIWRSTDNMNPVQAYFYFSPVFLLGCLCDKYKELINNYRMPVMYISFLLSVFFMMFQVFLLEVHGNLHKDFFVYEGININIIERTLFTVSMFVFFEVVFYKKNHTLNMIAESSFGIYLIHTIAIAVYTRLFPFQFNSIVYLFFLMIFITLVCFCFNFFTKLFFGKRARYFVG